MNNVEQAQSQFRELVEQMKDVAHKVRSDMLVEQLDAYQRFHHKAPQILKRLYALREAKRKREFQEYTTKPCGCYRDPGGHP